MGSKYPVLKPEQIIKVLIKLGYEKGTLKSILEQAKLNIDEFLEYLK